MGGTPLLCHHGNISCSEYRLVRSTHWSFFKFWCWSLCFYAETLSLVWTSFYHVYCLSLSKAVCELIFVHLRTKLVICSLAMSYFLCTFYLLHLLETTFNCFVVLKIISDKLDMIAYHTVLNNVLVICFIINKPTVIILEQIEDLGCFVITNY